VNCLVSTRCVPMTPHVGHVTHSFQTSASIRVMVSTVSVWRLALRDILEVKPIPRLRIALATMSSDQLKSACVRLAAHELSYATVSHPPLRMLREIEVGPHGPPIPPEGGHSAMFPVPVPGGDHFVILSRNRRKLLLYSSLCPDAGNTLLLPASKFSIRQWSMAAASADEVMVLIAGVSKFEIA
jgi:hypothetical protein